MAIDDPLRERIEAVLRTLQLRQDLSATELESRIAVAASELTRRAKITLSFLPDPGAPALDKQATEALQKLACSLDTAIHTLAFLLPEPAAVALVDAGLVPVSGGEKVGQWSGGVVLLRGGVITGHWLGCPFLDGRGATGDVRRGQLCRGPTFRFCRG